VPLVVRSWNVYHGNTKPPRRRSYLREMVDLVSRDADVVCLQEVPVWALSRLAAWSGMRSFGAVARGGLRPSWLAGWITRLNNGLLRSAIAGQANAILVSSHHQVTDLGVQQVSDPGPERRVCQAVRVEATVVANTHLSNDGAGPVQPLELGRTQAFAEAAARAGEPIVLAGDLNLRDPILEQFEGAGRGIDHILVRGAVATPLVVWPLERHTLGGLVLSDHAPVEREIG
jgi:endonuclease/exonuclease/phosphatase family metal-dependent hydrolase